MYESKVNIYKCVVRDVFNATIFPFPLSQDLFCNISERRLTGHPEMNRWANQDVPLNTCLRPVLFSSANKDKKQYGVGFITLPRQTLCDSHDKFLFSTAIPHCKAWRAEVKSDGPHDR